MANWILCWTVKISFPMKKIAFILLSFFYLCTLSAQTIEEYPTSQRYWFWPMTMNPFNKPNDAYYRWGCSNCDNMYHTDKPCYDLFPTICVLHKATPTEPKLIYGVAIPIWDSVQLWDDTAQWIPVRDSFFCGHVSIGHIARNNPYSDPNICDGNCTQILYTSLDTVHIRYGVNMWTENFFKLVVPRNPSCPDSIYHIVEIYFEQPYLIEDSFFVGGHLVFKEATTIPIRRCPFYGLFRAPIKDKYYHGGSVSTNNYFGPTIDFGINTWGLLFPIVAPPPCFVIPPLKIRHVRNTSVDVMWDNPVSSLYRRVELGPAGFTPGTGIVIDNFYGDSIHFQNLAPDLDYEVHVSSFCSTDSVYTEPTVAFFSTAMNCDMPQNVTVADITDSTAIVFWRMTSLSDYSELEYGPAGFSHGEGRLLSPIQSLGTGNCSRMMDSLQPGTAYTAYVRTWCEYSEMYSEWERVDFTTTGVNPNDTADHDTTGIATVAQQRVSIVPNPATNSVTVTAECEILSVEAYNVKGQRIATSEGKGTPLKLDTSAWPNGTYTITIRTVQGSVSRKLVIKK